jgi:tRNA-dihydrouridine synthase
MDNFWQQLPKPFFILAPMEAVTDVVFRHVVAKAGAPDVFFTEFTNTDSYCSPKGKQSTRGRLEFTDDEQPMVAHIWGKDPEHFRQMALGMKELGFAGIDINTGCPAKDVVKHGAGSGLIRTPDLAVEIIQATKEAGLPVSVKARLGDVKPEEWHDWLATILHQDIANLSIHLRTRKEMSKVPAHYELIADIKKLRDEIAPQTLLTINGDIRDRAHGLELVEQYGVDGIMIGRGVFSDPFAFAKRQPIGDRREVLMDLLNYQLDLFDTYSTKFEPRKFDPLKRFFKIFVRDFPGASELREQLMHTKNTDEVRALIQAP